MQTAQHEQSAAPEEQPAYIGTCSSNLVPQDHSPTNPVPKNVAFELLLDENSKVRARIPMRVQIYPHDTTDSIVTTVKNFYGIYDGAASGVSFEDESGITLIARYENLKNNMTVYVRVIPAQTYTDSYGDRYYPSLPIEARRRPSLGEPFQITQAGQPIQPQEHGLTPSQPASRVASKRSTSPPSRSRRSASQNKQGSRNGIKSRGSSTHGSFREDDAPGNSDSDGTYGSKKPRSEQFASSEISMDNILQDGRRKRPRFESSELPLFVPPQVPLTTSTSSISPQRRSIGQDGPVSPFARPMPRQYNYQPPLPSPQSYGHSEHTYGPCSSGFAINGTPTVPEHGHRLRNRNGILQSTQICYSNDQSNGSGVLPTPDPTIASCISDEDVAMQLIRLGDASNFSHGRNSASTMDDAFSGIADAASSTGATSDGGEFTDEEDDGLPLKARHNLESSPMLPPGVAKSHHKRLDEILPSFDSTDISGDDVDADDRANGRYAKNEQDDDTAYEESGSKAKKARNKAMAVSSSKSRSAKAGSANASNGGKSTATSASRKTKAAHSAGNRKWPVPSNTDSSAQGRKISASSINSQHQLAADEEDLSTKPRCQRCRKSKKGCDRQRPCGRCRDAGIGLEGCISEDEGNGRKGRYGRHMGVPVKKALGVAATDNDALIGVADIPVASTTVEKTKKRKR